MMQRMDKDEFVEWLAYYDLVGEEAKAEEERRRAEVEGQQAQEEE